MDPHLARSLVRSASPGSPSKAGGAAPAADLRAHVLRTACVVLSLSIANVSRAEPIDTFRSALLAFTSAAAGAYGDEGPQITASLDALERALAEWDRDLRVLQDDAALIGSGAPLDGARLLQLALLAFHRNDEAHALAALTRAAESGPSRAPDLTVAGHLYREIGRPEEAAAMHRRSWSAGGLASAYALWQLPADDATRDELAGSIIGWYRQRPAPGPPQTQRPFPDVSLLPDTATAQPLLPPAMYAEGVRRLLRGDLADGIAFLRHRAAADPLVTGAAATDLSIRQGIAALRAGRVREAQATLRESAARPASSSEVHRLLGLAYWADFRYDEAITQLRMAMDARPGDERPRLTLARVLVQSDRLLEASELLAETVAIVPESATAYWWLGTVYRSLNRSSEALVAFERASELPVLTGRAGLLGAIAQLRENHGDFEGAIDAGRARIAAAPNDVRAHMHLAHVYMQLGRHEDALVEYVAAAGIDGSLAAAHAGIGRVHLEAERYDDATIALDRAVELDPRSIEARYALALALRHTGRPQDADLHLAAVEQLQAQAIANRRRDMTVGVLKEEASLLSAEGAHTAAADLWERIVEAQPEVADHHARLATSLAAAGRIDAAIARYEHAATLRGDPYVFKELAALYARLGRMQESLETRDRYERALLDALGTPGSRP